MPTPFLLINSANGSPTVKRSVTGVASDVGVALGTVEVDLFPTQGIKCQRVIRFLGHSTWCVVQGNEILRTTNAGASYTTVFGPDADLGSPGAANACKTGPFLCYPGGTATLAIMATPNLAGSGTFKIFKSTDGVTWTKSATLYTGPGSGGYPMSDTVLWRGNFYTHLVTAGTFQTNAWNPGALTIAAIAKPAGADNAYFHALTVASDRLFSVFHDSFPSAGYSLYELVGGSWTFRVQVSAFGGAVNANAHPALFLDEASGELVYLSNENGAAIVAKSININTFAVTNISATISSAFGTVTNPASIRVLVDGSDPVGGTAKTYLYYLNSAGTPGPMTVYRWNGVASAPTSLGAGGDSRFSYPWGNQAQWGGNVFWTSGQRHVERVTATPALGGVTYGFRIYSPYPTVDTVGVRWLIGVNTDDYAHQPYGSLSNPSAGSITGGNTNSGLDAADNGATLFTVTWLAQADGFAVGDFAKTVPNIFS